MTSVPCSGKVEAHHLLSTLAADADGVLVVGCAKSACKYIEGSKRSTKRADYAKLWLKNLGIETDRIRFVHLPPTDTNALDGLLKEFASTLASFAGVSPIATQKAE
jgi:coenzyme F420-reducing hydrogenase delta subunit